MIHKSSTTLEWSVKLYHWRTLSRNCHRLESTPPPPPPRAIKEESIVANRDWADHQACSMLQYIHVIADIKVHTKQYFIHIHTYTSCQRKAVKGKRNTNYCLMRENLPSGICI